MATKTNWKVIVGAIAGIVILDGIALFKGIDGTMFSLSLAAIAGLAGYVLPSPLQVK